MYVTLIEWLIGLESILLTILLLRTLISHGGIFFTSTTIIENTLNINLVDNFKKIGTSTLTINYLLP